MSNIHKLNISKLDVRMLAALEVLLTERSVSRAAQSVGLTQPAMSNALARMRQVFGDPLLVRGRTGMMLTARAEDILAQLSEVVPQLETLGRSPQFDPTTAETVFRLAVTDHAGLLLSPAILNRMQAEAPNVQVEIRTIPSRRSPVDELESRRFDLRLGWVESLPPHWHVRKLMEEDLVIIAGRNNRQVGRTLSLDDFLRLKHVSIAVDHPITRNLADQALAKEGLARKVGAAVSSFTAMPFIVATTEMIAVFPARLAEQFERLGDIRVLPSPFQFSAFDLTMAWHPRVHRDSGHRWLRSIVIGGADGIG